MDLAHGFLAQQMTAHDQRTAEFAAERRLAVAERRRAARATAAARRDSFVAGLLARLHPGQAREAH
ncbi:hypothetical protein [Agromyces tropicus]